MSLELQSLLPYPTLTGSSYKLDENEFVIKGSNFDKLASVAGSLGVDIKSQLDYTAFKVSATLAITIELLWNSLQMIS